MATDGCGLAALSALRKALGFPTNGDWYYVGNDAFMVTGWLYDNGSWYWLDSYDGHMATGWIHDGTDWYYMDGSGRMQSGGWFC